VGLRAGLDAVAKRRILSPCRELNPGLPACGLIAIPTELSRLMQNLIRKLTSGRKTGKVKVKVKLSLCFSF
jgi:hypothetical protein